MAGRTRPQSSSRYSLKFALTALGLIATSLILVLVVLPRRYVLSSGFRESGVNFPSVADLPPVPELVARPAAQRPVIPVVGPEGRPVDPATEQVILPGPSEALWNTILPLLNAGEWPAALAALESYLNRFPDDWDVRREYATTLLRARMYPEGEVQLRALLRQQDNPYVRLTLARVLRDLGQAEAASAQYAYLWDREFMSEEGSRADFLLEWADALAWSQLYEDAEAVLAIGLAEAPDSPLLNVSLARIYYYTDRLPEAESILASLDDAALDEAGGAELATDIASALAVPEVEPEVLTPVDRAARAREEGDIDGAREILTALLADDPGDVEGWLAMANLLQYEVGDLPGALDALLRVESLDSEAGSPTDPALSYRIGLLQSWVGDTALARDRFAALYEYVQRSGPFLLGDAGEGAFEVNEAVVLSRLGDLERWSGDRLAASRLYRDALILNPSEPDAIRGSELVQQETLRAIRVNQDPRYGALAESFLDSDEYQRLDLGAQWSGTHREWIWGVRAGSRWLDGFDASGTSAGINGIFGAGEVGRWWRMGTLRTAVQLGVQDVESSPSLVTARAEVRYITGDGTLWLASAGRDAGFLQATTLQSVFLDVVQDALSVSVSARLSPEWSLWSEVQAGLITWDGAPDAVFRGSAAAALERDMGRGLSVGAELRGITLSGEAPLAGAFPAFWDPRLAISLTPLARWQTALARGLTLDARGGVGAAWVDERRGAEDGLLPVATLATELELERGGFRSTLGLFYRQSRFSGYRNWGGSFTVSRLLGGGS